MKNISYQLGTMLLLFSFFSCKKNDSGPSISDNILNYTINEIRVDTNYVVGAFYYNIGTWNANITEVPVIGSYTMPNGVVPPAVMTEHISQATKAGLDYFVFSFRSANRDLNNYKSDSSVVKSFLDANASTNMKFALQYNWSTGSFGVSNTAPLENDPVKLEQFFQDIQRVAPLFNNSNYMKVNGKTLLYIQNAQNLYSNNDSTIYATLRNRLNTLGFTMYIVGMQDKWTPPARYPFRYYHCVDAIYHQSYVYQLNQWDWFYLLPQYIDQNWEYSRQYFSNVYGVDYVPNISPAYNWLITNPTSTNPSVSRLDHGAMYTQLCNVAKMNVNPKTRLIMIDSWNDWQDDMQLEAATDYGDMYLNITKKEFKK